MPNAFCSALSALVGRDLCCIAAHCALARAAAFGYFARGARATFNVSNSTGARKTRLVD